MTTLEQLRKAYLDLSDEDKKAFEQSLKDRVDESVAAQENESDTEDSQTAKDRVNEAEGEKDTNNQAPPQEPSEPVASADTKIPATTETGAETQPQTEPESVEPGTPPQEELQEEKTELQDYKAMLGRVDSLENMLTGLIEMHEKLVSNLENGSFGAAPQPNEQGVEPLGRFEKMYRERAGMKG